MDEVIPVDVYIPGCPPRPEAVIDGIILLLTHLQGGARPARPQQPQIVLEAVA